ncbi:MAG: nucleotide sugar dehydrogenase, partial [Sphingomonadales bacterium]|nr:nucleotide sugar dehydrogenase [Sphingomonadales bacterium]
GKPGTALMLGLTFKEDVPDLRNSRVIDVIARLEALGHAVTVHDPLADPAAALKEHDIGIVSDLPDQCFDLVFAAVPHRAYREMDGKAIAALAAQGGLVADLTGIWRDRDLGDLDRWTL